MPPKKRKKNVGALPSQKQQTGVNDVPDALEERLAFLDAEAVDVAAHVAAFYRLTPQELGTCDHVEAEVVVDADVDVVAKSEAGTPTRDVPGESKPSRPPARAAAARSRSRAQALSASAKGGGGSRVGTVGVQLPNPFCGIDLDDPRGIWQEQTVPGRSLGDDPRQQLREGAELQSAMAPAGLKNLGATCYLNCLLQYLFFNVDFRRCLLSAPSASAVVKALQSVFALLAKGMGRVVDPKDFVDAARVDAVEQADATEFSTLLLDWLEGELGRRREGGSDADAGSAERAGGGFIPALFQGEASQALTCMRDPGHVFERPERFYELRGRLAHAPEPDPVGATNPEQGPAAKAAAKRRSNSKRQVQLEQLLRDTAFPDEILEGSNQYLCPKCDQKVDARKSTRLRKLPPYLHVTVERYAYDYRKGVRRKLNDEVSFPLRLEIPMVTVGQEPTGSPQEGTAGAEGPRDSTGESGEGPGSPEDPACTAGARSSAQSGPQGADEPVADLVQSVVAYECVGYLEHVSSSPHSGHYIATLRREESARTERTSSSVSQPSGAEEGASATGEPPEKRQKLDGGAEPTAYWWKLDDGEVSAVDMNLELPEGASTQDRVTSSSAYLVLYRRCDHRPGQLAEDIVGCGAKELPEPHASVVAATNSLLEKELDAWRERAEAVHRFVDGRRQAVEAARKELNAWQPQGDPGSIGAGLSFVPAAWWDAFIHGADRAVESLVSKGPPFEVAGLSSSVLAACEDGQVVRPLCPLAVWCGRVKLLPTAALHACVSEESNEEPPFPRADAVLSAAACEAVWRLFRAWREEQLQISRLLDGARLSAAEANAMEQEGRGDEVVWVACRMLGLWRKALPTSAGEERRRAAEWRAFLREAEAALWGTDKDGTSEELVGSGAAEAAARHEVSLVEGLVCCHGLVGRPRAGATVQREHVLRVLEAARAKERAYEAVRPPPGPTSVPRLRTGLPDERLLTYRDVCPECRVQSSRVARDSAGPAPRTLTIKRRFSSGVIRRVGDVKMPCGSLAPMTVDEVCTLVKEGLELPVARLWLPSPTRTRGGAQGTELHRGDAFSETVDVLVVERDEEAASKESSRAETAAFENSVFRTTAE